MARVDWNESSHSNVFFLPDAVQQTNEAFCNFSTIVSVSLTHPSIPFSAFTGTFPFCYSNAL